MNVTRNVILDLLPLYLANEASADTRTLIDEYLKGDPELAQRIVQQADEPSFAAAPDPPLSQEHELRTLERTRTMLRTQSILLGVAIFFSLLPLAGYDTGRHRWAMLSDFPAGAIACAVCALVTWVSYFLLKRTLRISGS